MKGKRCPYCGKRVSYASAYGSRRKAEYVCERCGKESRVVINKIVILVFLIFFLIAAGIMAAAIFTNNSYNPIFILLVAIPLLIFLFISPKFVSFEPLKKYKKSMEARKAGIEYSDNLMMSDFEPEPSGISSQGIENSGQFNINSDVFNKIKAERTAAREKINMDSPETDSERFKKIQEEAEESYEIESIEQAEATDNRKLHEAERLGRHRDLPLRSRCISNAYDPSTSFQKRLN